MKHASRKDQRMLLPRVRDLINDALAMQASCRPAEEVELFILDFRDALFIVPPEVQREEVLCGQAHLVFRQDAGWSTPSWPRAVAVRHWDGAGPLPCSCGSRKGCSGTM